MQKQEEIQMLELFKTISNPKDRQFILATLRAMAARQPKPKAKLQLVLNGLPLAANGDLLGDFRRFENIDSPVSR